ncbi:MAG: hypothetical protein CV087_08645 [Candidatus Brocadia sp. WS118]|nr:MAG: hypothetical protein CV087_08645 [Candidatus Brocadia sp. WS118]
MRKENYYKDLPNPEPSLLAQIKSLAEIALLTHDLNEKIKCLNQIIRMSDDKLWRTVEKKQHV